jgi:hypothetical protein
MSQRDGEALRLRAYLRGWAQAAAHIAWDTEGTYMVVEPRADQQRGWDDGIVAINSARGLWASSFRFK